MRSGLGDLNLALSSFISHYIILSPPHGDDSPQTELGTASSVLT